MAEAKKAEEAQKKANEESQRQLDELKKSKTADKKE